MKLRTIWRILSLLSMVSATFIFSVKKDIDAATFFLVWAMFLWMLSKDMGVDEK